MTATPTLIDLVSLAQQFNLAAGQKIAGSPAMLAAAKIAWTQEVQGTLDAIAAEAESYTAEQEEALAVLDANEPPQDIPEEVREFLISIGQGDQLPPKIDPADFVVDEEAVAAAEAKLDALNGKVAPLALKQEEVLAGVAATVLGDAFNTVVPDHVRLAEISDGFAAQGAPTLARAFAPRPV